MRTGQGTPKSLMEELRLPPPLELEAPALATRADSPNDAAKDGNREMQKHPRKSPSPLRYFHAKLQKLTRRKLAAIRSSRHQIPTYPRAKVEASQLPGFAEFVVPVPRRSDNIGKNLGKEEEKFLGVDLASFAVADVRDPVERLGLLIQQATSTQGHSPALPPALRSSVSLHEHLSSLNLYQEVNTEADTKLGQRDCNRVTVKRLSGAMTNAVYRVDTRAPMLLRIYGEGVDELGLDRQRELWIFQLLASLDMGPSLLVLFGNGRIEQFIPRTRPLTARELRSGEFNAQIARKMVELHSLSKPLVDHYNREQRRPLPAVDAGMESSDDEDNNDQLNTHDECWDRLTMWHEKAMKCIPDLFTMYPEHAERLKALSFLSPVEIQKLIDDRPGISDPEGFETFSEPVLTHLDLQYGNILMDTETQSLFLIDYEYAAFSHPCLDMANYFCEYAADYHSENPHLLDYSQIPSRERKREFMEDYLDARDHLISASHSASMKVPGHKSPYLSPFLSPFFDPQLTAEQKQLVRQKEIAQLLVDADYFELVSHALWGCWGLMQAWSHHNAADTSADFNYLIYGIQRWEFFWMHLKQLETRQSN